MSVVVRKTEFVEFDVHSCICGNAVDVTASHRQGSYSSGHAGIYCSACGLRMVEETDNMGYGETTVTIARKLVNRWNAVMPKKAPE